MKTAIRCRKCSQVFEVNGNDMDNICEPCYEAHVAGSPAGLVGALQGPVHKSIGVSRPAKSRKVDPKNLEAMRARMAKAREARAAKRAVLVTVQPHDTQANVVRESPLNAGDSWPIKPPNGEEPAGFNVEWRDPLVDGVAVDMGLQKDISARVTYEVQADGEMKLTSYSEEVVQVGSDCDPPEE